MKQYKRVMLGAKSKFAEECYNGKFFGADYKIQQDLTNELPENWRDFNKKFIPKWMELHPEKSKVSAGLACGMLWSICKGIRKGDIVLCPDGQGNYYVGEVVSDYHYHPNTNLQHRRTVQWLPTVIARSAMSESLQRSSGSIGTVSDITKYADEIEKLIGSNRPPIITTNDETIEDVSVFALEKHLEDFLVKNWEHTELGQKYDLFTEEGELVGQQYQSDTGPIDILAISKDQKEVLVIELKKGRASDSVVGQIQRYMGYVKEDLLLEGQIVRGAIIALEDDLRIQRALSVTNNIDFYRYRINFELIKN